MFATVGTVIPVYLMDPVRAGFMEELPQGSLTALAKCLAPDYKSQAGSQAPTIPEQNPSRSLEENHARNQASSQGKKSNPSATLQLYPIFYSIQPLLGKAFQQQPEEKTTTQALLDELILHLRLATLMRSVDVANIV